MLDFGGHEHLPGVRTPNAVGVGRGGGRGRPGKFGGFPKPVPASFAGNPPPGNVARPVVIGKQLKVPTGGGALPAWAEDK